MNVVEPFQRMARQQPGAPALLAAGKTTTYGELLAFAGGLANAFVADGVQPGHRIAVLGSPAIRVAGILALGWIGAVSVGITGMADDDLADLVGALELDTVYAPRDLDLRSGKVRAARIEPLLETLGSATPPPLHECAPADLWHITISSGTTGRPKGIACPYSSLVNVHLLRTLYPSGPGDAVVMVMNAAMSFSIHNWLRCLYSGACAVLAENMPVPELFKFLQSGQATHCMMTPVVANSLAQACVAAGAPQPATANRLHTISMGGGRVSSGVRALLRKHFCPNLLAHYGAAEAQVVAVLDPVLAESRPGCSGRLLPWIEAHAVGADGAVLPPGEVGRLRFRSPALASGYVGHTDTEAFRDGWFLSQDGGAVAADGVVFLRGRANDVINFAGRKFDPAILEEAILADQNILDCAVVDVPGALGPELVAVIVDPTEAADLKALVERGRKAMPGLTLRTVLRTQSLPRNPNGKIMRGAVRHAVKNAPKAGDAS
jgi:acyl-coenzyme A synthetase/AMP-(fatty) acid ligase